MGKKGGRDRELQTRESKINTAADEKKRNECGIEREITDPTSFKLLFHFFTTCFRPGLKFPMKTEEDWVSGC